MRASEIISDTCSGNSDLNLQALGFWASGERDAWCREWLGSEGLYCNNSKTSSKKANNLLGIGLQSFTLRSGVLDETSHSDASRFHRNRCEGRLPVFLLDGWRE